MSLRLLVTQHVSEIVLNVVAKKYRMTRPSNLIRQWNSATTKEPENVRRICLPPVKL